MRVTPPINPRLELGTGGAIPLVPHYQGWYWRRRTRGGLCRWPQWWLPIARIHRWRLEPMPRFRAQMARLSKGTPIRVRMDHVMARSDVDFALGDEVSTVMEV